MSRSEWCSIPLEQHQQNGTALRNGHSPVMALPPMLYRKRSLTELLLGSQQGVRYPGGLAEAPKAETQLVTAASPTRH